MTDNNIQGLIWYDDEFHSGLKEDYEAYAAVHSDTKLFMSYFVSSTQELAKIVKTLNNSNLNSKSKS